MSPVISAGRIVHVTRQFRGGDHMSPVGSADGFPRGATHTCLAVIPRTRFKTLPRMPFFCDPEGILFCTSHGRGWPSYLAFVRHSCMHAFFYFSRLLTRVCASLICPGSVFEASSYFISLPPGSVSGSAVAASPSYLLHS